jgi:amidophosphoribosyltransferase
MGRIEGAYGVISLIAHHGLLAFRDPNGIRPLVLGRRRPTGRTGGSHAVGGHDEWVVASPSPWYWRTPTTRSCARSPRARPCSSPWTAAALPPVRPDARLEPCSFEYVYLARPDSVMNGISVYDSRLRMGARLATTIAEHVPTDDVDVVMPIPDSARPAAMEVARVLDLPYREGFFKNRYVGRTFIMPGQAVRKKSVRQKLNAMSTEFAGKHVLLIDDSIVRGTTSYEIIAMARAAGARKVSFASAAPRSVTRTSTASTSPTGDELVASDRTVPEVCEVLGADHLVYQKVEDLEAAILDGQTDTELDGLDMSCFDGDYVTGTVTDEYLGMAPRQPGVVKESRESTVAVP